MGKFDVKSRCSTTELRRILLSWRFGDEGGILGVAVKCVDIERNADGESSPQDEI